MRLPKAEGSAGTTALVNVPLTYLLILKSALLCASADPPPNRGGFMITAARTLARRPQERMSSYQRRVIESSWATLHGRASGTGSS